MLSLKKLEKEEYQKKQNKKIERELPYFITIVSLLAASGSGPYTLLQRLKEITLLPITRFECVKILKRIDLMGVDPLIALSEAKDRPSSKALGEFLGGYVSAIQSGGNVVNYLKSKMSSAFEILENVEKNAVEKLSGVVHGWLTMQIVVLAVFILISAIGSNPIDGSTAKSGSSDSTTMLLLFSPITSVMFMKIVQKMNDANIKEIPIKKVLRYGLPCIGVAAILIVSNALSGLHADPYIIGIALTIAAIPPAREFKKLYALNLDAERATPQLLRDITEARKAGMGPEKCIIHACKRDDFKLFNSITKGISNKLEWGVPIDNIFNALEKEIQNFQVLISFKILFEIISSGGGNVNTLDSLADTSEKVYNISKNKRDTLKVYSMVGFMLITITGFTTLLTIDSFSVINEEKNLGNSTGQSSAPSNLMVIVSIGLVIQAWLSGLFLGKVTKGAFSGGYVYAILLTIITMGAIALIQFHIVNLAAFLHHS